MNDEQFFLSSGFSCSLHAGASRASTQNASLKITNNIFPVTKLLGPKRVLPDPIMWLPHFSVPFYITFSSTGVYGFSDKKLKLILELSSPANILRGDFRELTEIFVSSLYRERAE